MEQQDENMPDRKTGTKSPNPLERVSAMMQEERIPPQTNWDRLAVLARAVLKREDEQKKELDQEWVDTARELAAMSLTCAREHSDMKRRAFMALSDMEESNASTTVELHRNKALVRTCSPQTGAEYE